PGRSSLLGSGDRVRSILRLRRKTAQSGQLWRACRIRGYHALSQKREMPGTGHVSCVEKQGCGETAVTGLSPRRTHLALRRCVAGKRKRRGQGKREDSCQLLFSSCVSAGKRRAIR